MPTECQSAITATVAELGKNPKRYFREEPVPIMSGDRIVGYALGRQAYERIVAAIVECAEQVPSLRRFLPVSIEIREMLSGQYRLSGDPDGDPHDP